MSLDPKALLSIGRVAIADMLGRIAKIDSITWALSFVSWEHHEIHEGDHFNLCDYDLDVGSAEHIRFTVQTPDTTKWGHFTFSVYSSLGATIELYSDTTGITVGTAEVPRNNNGNSLNESAMAVKKNPTIAVLGTRVAGFLAGAGRVAGATERDKENVLKQNTAFTFDITSLANANKISWCFEWYEHTSKV